MSTVKGPVRKLILAVAHLVNKTPTECRWQHHIQALQEYQQQLEPARSWAVPKIRVPFWYPYILGAVI